jgi:nucleotide-binding universal stress UspA family protein
MSEQTSEQTIVGVDGSGPSGAALTWAIAHSARSGSDIVIHHVVDDEWGQVGASFAQDETHAGERILLEALDQCRLAGRSARTALSHGSPAWELAAAGRPGDILVVGTHKTGYLRGRVLGTRSIVVASVAQCSVVIVPEDNLSHRHGIVVGVAAGTQSHAAIIAGAEEALRLRQELSLIHAGSEDGSDGRTLLSEAANLAATAAPGITIRRRVAQRRPSEALLDASRSALLLVLGTSRIDPDRAGFIGSVTHEVLLNLNAPVMVAR